jgi:membrane fusion protein (multidrug efflux system)
MRKRIVTVVSSVAALAVVGLAVWLGLNMVGDLNKYSAARARDNGSGVPVKVEAVRLEEFPDVIGAHSLAAPTATIDVRTQLAGRVLAVTVDIGHLVRKGQTLAELDSTLYRASVKSAEAAVDRMKAEVENSRVYLERVSNLYSQRLIPKVQVEEASLRLETARQTLVQAEQELERARYDLRNVVITSPAAGVIIQRSVNPGEAVQGQQSLFSLGDTRSIMVVADVPEEKAGNVRIGQRAEIVFDAYKNWTLSGEVEKIDYQTDSQKRTFRAYIKVADPESKLKSGLAAYARLDDKRRALTVPRLAVIDNAGEATVFVVEDSRAHLRRIRTGASLLERVEVVSGLKEGDRVVYYGLLNLKDNDPVNTSSELFEGTD